MPMPTDTPDPNRYCPECERWRSPATYCPDCRCPTRDATEEELTGKEIPNGSITFGRYVVEGGKAYRMLAHDIDKTAQKGDEWMSAFIPGITDAPDEWSTLSASAEMRQDSLYRRPLPSTPATYALLQAAFLADRKIGVGTRVRVVRIPASYEIGWPSRWTPAMDAIVSGTVVHIGDDIIIETLPDRPICGFPFHVLEPLPLDCEVCKTPISDKQWPTCEKCDPAPTDAKGEACRFCGKPAACFGQYEGDMGYACHDCCGHGNEVGWCDEVTNPAAIISSLKFRLNAMTSHCERFKKAYYDVADAVCSESTGVQDVCEKARSTRTQITALRSAAEGARRRLEKTRRDLMREGYEQWADWISGDIKALDAALATSSTGESTCSPK